MKWRFVDTGFNDGATNMAIDEAILRHCGQGTVPPTLRFYRWLPAALSLGYFQRVDQSVNTDVCCRMGIDIVRRLTGGRAVLHNRELTYSIVIPAGHHLIPSSVTESYRVLASGLLAGLTCLGLDVQMATRRKTEQKHVTNSAACFNTLAPYELIANGKKIVGSAQVRQQGIILQHGSLPWSLEEEQLFHVLRFPDQNSADEAKQAFMRNAGCLQTVDRDISWNELSEAILKGFNNALQIEFYRASLTSEEMAMAGELAESKYRSRQWTYKF